MQLIFTKHWNEMAMWLWLRLLMTNTFCLTQVFSQLYCSVCMSCSKQCSDNATGPTPEELTSFCLQENFKICDIFHPHLDLQSDQIILQNFGDKKD